ncbi:hypothetical protein F444_19250 [Phytophthora nicotianae P1976]|uniref:Uncharacterized protein n=1 Tax=Phytophthora nicotianae P1976 TaxID=1317066 RepID=A0A080Z8H4_PHYNI|nr:hypothetical protein F444_19250 [Phytophthora nicotianae P1976]
MGGGDVDKAFTVALERTGTTLTSQDLVEQYAPLPQADKQPIVLEQCKFFALFDADPV